ncbi:MAG: recombinase RecA, partial [Proteobacteria bacterium]|nr:recombinase RecA [Pseudomonadota bacterium]
IGGGTGLKYAASTIAMLSKKKEKDGDGDVIGNQIKIKTYKSRLSKENQEATVLLTYSKGLDRYFGLLDLAEKYEVIKKVSTRYELPDGRKVFGKEINTNPELYFTEEVLAKLEECAKKEYRYGVTAE